MILNKNNHWPQNAVIYQIYPRSFKDTNNDGIGDIPGIIEKLDYLQELGINTIWLSPIFTSPMADFGYDISDYCNIEPIFGTLEDFDHLVKDVHSRDIKILLDFVPNHTSTQHPWFLESKSSKNNPKRDWYIWQDPKPDGSPPNNWISDFGGSAWEYDENTKQYYLHSFVKEQADLNWRNPKVEKAMFNFLRFWLKKGVDGFRVDAFNYIYKHKSFSDNHINKDYTPEKDNPLFSLIHKYSKDQPELIELIKKFNNFLGEFGDKFMVTESYVSNWQQLITFYKAGTFLQSPFNFEFINLPWKADSYKNFIDEFDKKVTKKYLPTYVLGNHDRPRIANRIGKENIRVAALLQLTLRGVPTIYYGEELGMVNGVIPQDKIQDPFEKNVPGIGWGRDPERTPMQWTPKRYSGFSKVEPWLPIPESAQINNVELEQKDVNSILTLYKTILHYRRTSNALLFGEYQSLKLGDLHIFAYTRTYKNEKLLVVLNFSNNKQLVKLPYKKAKLLLNTLLDKKSKSISIEKLLLRPHEGILFQI